MSGILAAAVLVVGCASVPVPESPASYSYFERPDPYDPWFFPISRWQLRTREQARPTWPPALLAAWGGAVPGAPVSAENPSDLRSRYFGFVAQSKHAVALAVASWVQNEGRRYYVSDTGQDHWPTLEEVLANDGDDCDGLELLSYYLLLRMGFDEDEVYRAIVVRERDNQHHMVTLWFETPDDPHVIDPTGAMVLGMPRMSEVKGWVPMQVFSPTKHFAVWRKRAGSN